jgi:hypothetical protein
VQVNRCQPSIGVNPEQLAGMTNDDLKRELLHAISAADQCAFDAVQKEIAKRIVAAVTKAA